ncbi:MAG: class I SAM-dependent methyltransferase [Streptosporangiaceae bacterium]
MRQPRWRTGETDWGLPPPGRWAALLEVRDLRLQLVHALTEGRRAAVLRRLAARTRPLVSLGSGPHVPAGWLGLDRAGRKPDGDAATYCWDLNRGLPFADGTLQGVLLEHALEHLYLDDAVRLLAECRRCLAPGAAIRVVSPDARFVADLVLGRANEQIRDQLRYDRDLHRWSGEIDVETRTANRICHQWGQHRCLLSARWCAQLLTSAGFTAATTVTPTTSQYFDPVPSTHISKFPGPSHEAFGVEARVPESIERPH